MMDTTIKTEPEAIDIFNLPGHFNSLDLADQISLLHKRKAMVNSHVKNLQSEISRMKSSSMAINYTMERSQSINTLNNYLKEQTGINEMLASLSALYKKSIDQIFIDVVLRNTDSREFLRMFEEAKRIYKEKNKKQ